MIKDPILKEYVNANYLKSGLETLRLFKFKDSFFSDLKLDIIKITTEYPKSVVADKGHSTNWTGLHGNVYQWSVLNVNGSTNNPDKCKHLYAQQDKRLHIPNVPALQTVMEYFKDSMVTCRINYMGPDSWLNPHKEWIAHKDERGVFARMRFHIPIITNSDATAQLNDIRIHMSAGYLYLFNNGTVHDARNEGDSGRYHLVIDCLVTEKLLENMFYNRSETEFWMPSEHVIVPKEYVEIPNKYPEDGNSVNEMESVKCKVL